MFGIGRWGRHNEIKWTWPCEVAGRSARQWNAKPLRAGGQRAGRRLPAWGNSQLFNSAVNTE